MPTTNKIFFVLLLVLLTACSSKKNIDEIFQNRYEVIILSTNFETPSVNLEENHLKEILVLLHNNFTAEKIKEHFKLSDSVYALRINELFGEGLIKKKEDGGFIPTCMIADFLEGNAFKKTADSLGLEMSGIVIDRISKIKDVYSKINSFKEIPFEEASLFVLSNVMHNHWQMKFIEEKFTKAQPPKRGISRYYLAILEKNVSDNIEPFGLYVNYFRSEGKNIYGKYGNIVADPKTMLLPKETDEIIKNKKTFIPVFNKDDQTKLESIASIITQDLLNYLERNRTLFIKLYLNSAYKDQTSFREWFSWFYQFMIAKTTNTLMEKGFIQIRSLNNSAYVLVK